MFICIDSSDYVFKWEFEKKTNILTVKFKPVQCQNLKKIQFSIIFPDENEKDFKSFLNCLLFAFSYNLKLTCMTLYKNTNFIDENKVLKFITKLFKGLFFY